MPDTMEKWFLGFLLWCSAEGRYEAREVELRATTEFDAKLMAKRYWQTQFPDNKPADKLGPHLNPASHPHLIFRKNLFPGSALFDWDENQAAGSFLMFTIWDDNMETEVLVRERLCSRLTDQAWVEALWMWKAKIRNHLHYKAMRTIGTTHPPTQIDYPHSPYLAIRRPFLI